MRKAPALPLPMPLAASKPPPMTEAQRSTSCTFLNFVFEGIFIVSPFLCQWSNHGQPLPPGRAGTHIAGDGTCGPAGAHEADSHRGLSCADLTGHFAGGQPVKLIGEELPVIRAA